MLNSKLLYKILCVLMLAILMCGCGRSNNSKPLDITEEKHTGIDGYYVYPDKPIGGGKYYAIPEDTLEAMTNEQLAQAVLDFPQFVDFCLLSILPEEGDLADRLREECDAYSELILRKNGIEELIRKIKEVAEDSEKSSQYAVNLPVLCEVLLDDVMLRLRFTDEQKDVLEEHRFNKSTEK